MKMAWLRTLIILSGLISFSGTGWGATGLNEEIDHLLSFIGHSECIFYRNGMAYDSADAKEHIERKYNHLKKKITTTDQFIRYAASKSSISGKAYTVVCDGVKTKSSEWLLRELEKYRSRRGS